MRHTTFPTEKIQIILARRHALDPGGAASAPVVRDYEEFIAEVPETTPEAFARLGAAALAQRAERPVYVGGSSGTTSKSKLVLNRVPVPGTTPSEEDKALVTALLRGGVFRAGDVAVNAFTVGLFSLLHPSMNRLLEACRVSVVPLGAPDEAAMASQLAMLAAVRANVLVGTPGTLVQLAHAALDLGVPLAIERIVFTGERMGRAKAAVLARAFPSVRIVGLFGISECGFLGFGDETTGVYDVFDGSYFLEVGDDGRLLVTALDASQPVPVVRYAPGDRVQLSDVGGRVTLRHVERSNQDFNFMGNLVELGRIRDVLATRVGADPVFEVELTTGDDGRDRLAVRLFADGEHAERARGPALEELSRLPELREALDKRAGTVDLVLGGSLERATLSGRAKHRQIIDLRR